MAGKGNSAVVLHRVRATIALAPSTLGYSSLTDPDTYDPDKPAFKLNAHFSPPAIAQMAEIIAEKCYSAPELAKLREDMEGNGHKWKDPMDPADWLGQKLKEPKPAFPIQLPYLVIATRASFKGRDGAMVTKDMGCWDAKNTPLDLAACKLGRGSTIQAIVHPNVFFSKVIGVPQPKLDLAGVRVLVLQRFGGQRPPEEVDVDDIKEVLGEIAMDDLSAYAVGAGGPAQPPAHGDGEVTF